MESATSKTLKSLWGLVRHMVINHSTIAIYVYLINIDGEPTPFRLMEKDTRLSTRTIQKHINILVVLGLIEKSPGVGPKASTYETIAFAESKLVWYLPLFLDPSTSLRSLPKSFRAICLKASNILDSIKEEEGRVPHYEETDLWYASIEILSKYFKPYELATRKPLDESQITLLRSIRRKGMLPTYAKWYLKKKYPKKGFGWGLFLFGSMYLEFESYHKNLESLNKHLHTSSKEQKAKFARKAEETKKWIGSLDLDEEGNKK